MCSLNGYTVITINGVFTNKDGAIKTRDKLKRSLDEPFNNQPLTVDFLHNPLTSPVWATFVISAYQKDFDNETVKDYDLVEMLKDAGES